MNDPRNIILTNVDKKGKIGHKDNFLTKGIRTTAGSKLLDEYIPQYSSTVVESLEEAGIVTHSKLNLDAWAHGSSGENSDYGATKNPWNEEYTAGGSCSGSGAAVTADICQYATGTDTGGSIRLPASFTNTTALKPSYGALSRYGIVAMSSSLDCPSFIAKTTQEVEKLFLTSAKQDVHDATTTSPLRLESDSTSIKTIGLPKEYFTDGLDPDVKDALDVAIDSLKDQGYEFKEISLPNTKYGIAVYYLIQTTEVASNLGRYDGVRYGKDREAFESEAKRRIMLGTFSSSSGYSAKYYEKAAKVRSLIIKDFTNAFKEVDAILAPVSPTPPFKLGEKSADPLQMYLSDALTVNPSLAGLPALSLPCGFSQNKLPIGMQIIGPRWHEQNLFEIGKKYQEETDWHAQSPKGVK